MSHQIYLRQYGFRTLATWVLFMSVCCRLVAAEAVAEPVKTNGIAASLQPFVDRGTLAGAVMLVTTREKIVSHDTVGMADIAAKIAMLPDALFWIASMSKPMTGTALMMLVDEGKVKLEDSVSTYIPEFATVMVTVKNGDQATYQKPARPVTVRDVMCHASGMVFLLPAEKGKIDVLSIADSVAQSIKVPLLFEPGSAYQYSNCGINTGGRIIEMVSGKPYEQFMHERLFEPLGMRDTCSILSPDQLKRLAKSYRPNAEKTLLNEVEINYLTYPLDAATRHSCPGGGFFPPQRI